MGVSLSSHALGTTFHRPNNFFQGCEVFWCCVPHGQLHFFLSTVLSDKFPLTNFIKFILELGIAMWYARISVDFVIESKTVHDCNIQNKTYIHQSPWYRAVAFYARVCSCIPHHNSGQVWNTYVIVAELFGIRIISNFEHNKKH